PRSVANSRPLHRPHHDLPRLPCRKIRSRRRRGRVGALLPRCVGNVARTEEAARRSDVPQRALVRCWEGARAGTLPFFSFADFPLRFYGAAFTPIRSSPVRLRSKTLDKARIQVDPNVGGETVWIPGLRIFAQER